MFGSEILLRNYGLFIIGGNTLWPGDPDGRTSGHYVFIKEEIFLDQKGFQSLLSHEYIHTLQTEGGGPDFGMIYAAEFVNRGEGPENRWEAPAYLWGGWIQHFGPRAAGILRKELPPWCFYRPLGRGFPAECS